METLNQEKLNAELAYQKLEAALMLLGFTPVHNPERSTYTIHLKGTKGTQGLYLSAYKGRINVSGEYPRTAKGEYIRPYEYNESAHEIGISLDKAVEKIAADIKRRFLPKYEEILAKVEKKIAATNSYEEISQKNLETLKGFGLDQFEKDRKTFQLHLEEGQGYGSVSVSGDSVSIDIRSVSVDQAKKILAILGK